MKNTEVEIRKKFFKTIFILTFLILLFIVIFFQTNIVKEINLINTIDDSQTHMLTQIDPLYLTDLIMSYTSERNTRKVHAGSQLYWLYEDIGSSATLSAELNMSSINGEDVIWEIDDVNDEDTVITGNRVAKLKETDSNEEKTKIECKADKQIIIQMKADGMVRIKVYAKENEDLFTQIYVKVATTPTAPTGIRITSNPVLAVGNNYIVTAEIEPANVPNQNVIWQIEDAGIVTLIDDDRAGVEESDRKTTIASEGIKLIGKSIGTTNLTAKTEDGRKVATCEVEVRGPVAVTAVRINNTYLDKNGNTKTIEEGDTKLIKMLVGDTASLSATLVPEHLSNNNMFWTSSNETVARVDYSSGKVTALRVGSATLVARSNDGPLDSINIEVSNETVSVTGIELLNEAQLPSVLDIGGELLEVKAVIKPEESDGQLGATNQNVIWSIKDNSTNIAIIDNEGTGSETNTKTTLASDGIKIKAKNVGEAILVATSEENSDISKEYRINVIKRLESASILPQNRTIILGNGLGIVVTKVPQDATIKNTIWSSSNPSVATVENGIVETHSVGTTTITVTLETEMGNKTASCIVTVKNDITGVSIQQLPYKTTYRKGERINLYGGKLNVSYENGTTKIIPMTSTGVYVSGFESNLIKPQDITLTYGGKSVVFNVVVNNEKVNIELNLYRLKDYHSTLNESNNNSDE